jgi:putative component of toxin-antitoxin plasmid stabilization module
MVTIGKGVWEMRISDEAGQFRIISSQTPRKRQPA